MTTPTPDIPEFIDIVFDSLPSHEGARFIEVENPQRQSIRYGEWIKRDDGYAVLRIHTRPTPPADAPVTDAQRDVKIDFDTLLAREIQTTLRMYRNRAEPLRVDEITTTVGTEKYASILDFAIRHYRAALSAPVENNIDLSVDAYNRTMAVLKEKDRAMPRREKQRRAIASAIKILTPKTPEGE